MISSILDPRSDLADCSPSTQRMASVILLFPLPLGPTTAVTPGTNLTSIRSAKDLKPTLSNRFKYINILLRDHFPINNYLAFERIYFIINKETKEARIGLAPYFYLNEVFDLSLEKPTKENLATILQGLS